MKILNNNYDGLSSHLIKYISVAISVTCIKCLLIASYYSTDLEVHRNWLSITYNLDLSQWYVNNTSEWTLDYPPLFAWFELLLSQFAPYFDDKMLTISSVGYISDNTIIFQRLTVIITDMIYYYACYEWCEFITKIKRTYKRGYHYSLSHVSVSVSDEWFSPKIIVSMLFLWNPALIIVDHIHFQYNGILSGIMLLSLLRMCENRYLSSAFWFTILLNMKHIYLYISPPFAIYLLRNYCFDRHFRFKLLNFIKLSAIVLLIFIVSFGPFVATNQLNNVISRLFPFKRGLTHAYWAPNFWALYNTMDVAISLLANSTTHSTSMTGGKVQQFSHNILFNITPPITLLCVLISIAPSLVVLWKKSHQSVSQLLFVRCVVICAFSSFLFGWHVHEKAILLIILPLTPLSMVSQSDAKIFCMTSTIGIFALFPLLFKEFESLTKILLLLMYSVYSYKSLETVFVWSKKNNNKSKYFHLPLMNLIESIYLSGLIALQLIYSYSCLFEIGSKYLFMPLLLISTYCSVGLIYCYIYIYKLLF